MKSFHKSDLSFVLICIILGLIAFVDMATR